MLYDDYTDIKNKNIADAMSITGSAFEWKEEYLPYVVAGIALVATLLIVNKVKK